MHIHQPCCELPSMPVAECSVNSEESSFSWNYFICVQRISSYKVFVVNPQQPDSSQLPSNYNSQHVEKIKVHSSENITITHHWSTVVFLSLMSISSVHCTQSHTVCHIQHSPRYTVIKKIVIVYLYLSVTSQTWLWLVPKGGDNIVQAVCRTSDTL